MLLSGPRFNFPDLNILFSVLLSIGCFVLFALHPRVNYTMATIMSICGLSILYSTFVVAINGFVDISIISDAIRLNIWCYSSIAICLLYGKYYSSTTESVIVKHIQIVYIINSMFVLFVMFVPSVKQFALTHLSNNDNMLSIVARSIRSVDLVMGGGAVTSVVFSAVFFLSLSKYYLMRDKLSLFSMTLCLSTILFTGRTGGVLIILAIIPVLLLLNFSKFRNFRLLRLFSYLIASIVLICSLLYGCFLLISYFDPELASLVNDRSLSWGLELFLNLFSSSGGLSTDSTSSLMVMYSGIGILDVFSLFGTSYSGRDESIYYLYTDVGYLRALFSIGFVGVIIIVSKYIYIFIHILKDKALQTDIRLILKVAVLYYLFAIFVTNFKEYHEAVRSGFPLLLIMFFILFYKSKVRMI
jgi:hypothetical protein